MTPRGAQTPALASVLTAPAHSAQAAAPPPCLALPCFLLFTRTSSCLEKACFKVKCKCKCCLFWDDSPATPRENPLPSLLHWYLAPPLVLGLLTLP